MSTSKYQVVGLRGKSAYEIACAGGYTGTEEKFYKNMADTIYIFSPFHSLGKISFAVGYKYIVPTSLNPPFKYQYTSSVAESEICVFCKPIGVLPLY